MEFFNNITKVNSGGEDFIEVNFNGHKDQLGISLFHNFKTSLELYYSGKINFALEQLLKVKAASPNNSSLNYAIAYIYEETGDFNNALTYYELANKQCACFWIEFRKGLCSYNLKKYEKAVSHYSSVINTSFSDFQDHLFQNFTLNKSTVYNNRGLCYAMIGDSRQCIIDCSKAIELKTDYQNPYFVRGIEYFKNGLLEQAKKDIIKSINLGNTNAKNILLQIETAQKEHLTKVKSFSSSPQAIQMAGGRRLSDYFIGDLSRLINNNNPQTYADLKSIIKPYSIEMWAEFKKNTGKIDYFNKTLIAYEVVYALTKIYQNLPFEEFYYSILE